MRALQLEEVDEMTTIEELERLIGYLEDAGTSREKIVELQIQLRIAEALERLAACTFNDQIVITKVE